MANAIKHLQLVVESCDSPAPGIRRLILADQERWRLPSFRPGAHIDLHLSNNLVRTYSLCNAPFDSHRYILAVKLEENGRGGSVFIHHEISPGSTIGVSVPRGGMETSENSINIFIAGGIGITPFISAIQDMDARGLGNYELHWASMGDPSLLDMIRPAYDAGRVKLYNTLVVPPPDIAGILDSHGEKSKAFCCGPAGMLDAFESATIGWPVHRKHVERFTASKPAPALNAVPYTVVLAKTGKEAQVLPEVGLLGTLESLNADISVSCAGGICGACRTRWLEGPPIHHDRILSNEERQHEVMVCVAECAGNRLVLDL